MRKISIEEMINYLTHKRYKERENVKFYIDNNMLQEINYVDILNDEILYGDNRYYDCFNKISEDDDKTIYILEPIKLSTTEKMILENLNKQWKYIARDADGKLRLYRTKPIKNNIYWRNLTELDFDFPNLFQFIKWEDEEPYEIEELLKGE